MFPEISQLYVFTGDHVVAGANLPAVVIRILSAPPLGAPSTSSNAVYTLIGAAVAATASLLAVTLKYWLDARMEQAKHAREMDKLQAEQKNRRREKTQALRLEAATNFMVCSHVLYDHVRDARYRRRLQEISDSEYIATLKTVPSQECRSAIETIRLVSSPQVVQEADALWEHLRSHDIPLGASTKGSEWVAWKDEYWKKRQAFSTACKSEFKSETK